MEEAKVVIISEFCGMNGTVVEVEKVNTDSISVPS
jgi:hypothetical protein